MQYQISTITDDGWIAIDSDGYGEKPAIVLAQTYQQEIGGTLVKPYEDDAQYLIKGDPYKLVFQYDDMFGTVVILNKMEDKDAVVELLKRLFQTIKDQ